MRAHLSIAILITAACAFIAAAAAAPADPDGTTFARELAKRFQYGPPQPPPAEIDDRAAGQAADAAYFTAFTDYDRSYTSAARAQAHRLAEQLRAAAATLSHEQFTLRVAEIAATADNGHTSVGENAFKKDTPRLPLRTFLFADGLYVLWATPANAALLGARIDTIDGHGIDDVFRAIRKYQGGTETHRRAQLVPMLESPALLQAAGVANGRDALTLTGVRANGQAFTQTIIAEQRDRSAWVSSTVRTLFPRPPGGPMESFLKDGAPLPVYLREPKHLFALADLPQGGVYIGLAHNADADEGRIAPFLDRALAHVRDAHASYVVLDMRMNGGGDYTTTYAFARALPAATGGAVYVLTSRFTFSAAITTVAALKDAGGPRVTIVGEPVGDRLDFWAEGSAFELPNAFLVVHYATGRHVYDGPCRDHDTCFWLNERYPVRVRTLAPDIAAPLTFAAYREARDPAIDAVLARETHEPQAPIK